MGGTTDNYERGAVIRIVLVLKYEIKLKMGGVKKVLFF